MPKKAKKNSPILLIVQSFPLSHAPGGIRQAQTKKKKRTFCNFDLFLGHLGHVNRGLPLYLSVRMKHDNEKKKNCQKEKKLQFWRPFFFATLRLERQLAILMTLPFRLIRAAIKK